jgi:hypothetical protein
MIVTVRSRTLCDAERRAGADVPRGGSAPPQGTPERFRTVDGGLVTRSPSPAPSQRSGQAPGTPPTDRERSTNPQPR